MDVYSELVESLENCVAACNNCAASCLNGDNVSSMTECIKLDLDCGDACHLTLKLLARDSNHAVSVVELCKDICTDCAEECAKHDADHCQLCAMACRDCAERCSNYIEDLRKPVTVE